MAGYGRGMCGIRLRNFLIMGQRMQLMNKKQSKTFFLYLDFSKHTNMKKNLLLTLITLVAGSAAFAQCAGYMTGTFIQVDSCSSFSQSYTRTVTTGDVGFDNLMISNFGNFNPPNDVQVSLDCSNNTLTMYQTLGTTNLVGSGTFSSNYETMMIAYNVDFGSSSMNCIDNYTRSTSGIEDLNFPLEVIAYPNPANDYIKVKVSNLLQNNKVTIFDSTGRIVIATEIAAGKDEVIIDLVNIRAGIYNVQVSNGKRIVNTFVQRN